MCFFFPFTHYRHNFIHKIVWTVLILTTLTNAIAVCFITMNRFI